MSKATSVALEPLWDDLSLRPYLGEIRRRHGIIEILALPSMRDLPPVRLETLFVQPLLAEHPVSPDSDPKKWPPGQNLFAALAESPRLVLLGDPGSGKTTLANWLAWRLSAGLTEPLPTSLENRLPLPCVLREMKTAVFSAETTLLDLAERLARHLLGSKADSTLIRSLRARVQAGRYLLILDGLDEIPLAHRKTVAAWMQEAFMQEAYVLATSRVVGYEDEPIDQRERRRPDLRLGLSIGYVSMPVPWAQRRYLMPFDDKRIAQFSGNWYRLRCGSEQEAQQKTADLLTALRRSEVTQRLARTPNLLTLMAIVHRERAHLPDGKALLYDEIANAYINTIDSQRRIVAGDALAPFEWKARRAWLARVGFEMQKRRNLGTEIENYWISEASVLASEADVLVWLTEAMQVSGVTDPKETARLFLDWVARRSGLLLPRGEGLHAFVHLSFQEYFCACFLADRIVSPAFVKKGTSSDGLVSRDLLRQWGGESVWRETLVFLFELLSDRDPDWIDDLVVTLFSLEADDWSDDRAALAARALADRHVRLELERRECLADRCAIWTVSLFRDDILISLIEADYAAVVSSSTLKKISKKTQLRVLSADKKSIIDLSSLAGLSALRVLHLDGTGVSDLGPLAGLSALRVLHLDGTGVSDLGPLAGLSALRVLHLDGTGVSDLGPLAGLSALRVLHLDGTGVSDLGPLAGLSALRVLHLDGTGVSDLGPLAGLSALRVLHLDGTGVSDLGPLAGLSALQWLDLNGTGVSDLGPLAGLSALQWLDLNGTGVSDLGPLAGLSALRELHLDGTGVSDLGPLAGLSALWVLHLDGTGVSDLGPLAGLSALRELHLNGTGVSDLGPLAGLSALRELHLNGTGVSDLGPLAGLSALRELHLDGTGVSDLGPLAGLSALQWLDLDGTGVSDLGPLAGLSALQWLDLNGTGVSDLGPLAGLSALRELHLDGTGVSDLGPLAGLSALWVLHLDGTGVSDLGPLAGLSALRELHLNGTGVSDLGPLAGLSALQRLDLDGTGVSDLGPLAGLSALQWLDLNGTGVSDLGPLAGLPQLTIYINGRQVHSETLKSQKR